MCVTPDARSARGGVRLTDGVRRSPLCFSSTAVPRTTWRGIICRLPSNGCTSPACGRSLDCNASRRIPTVTVCSGPSATRSTATHATMPSCGSTRWITCRCVLVRTWGTWGHGGLGGLRACMCVRVCVRVRVRAPVRAWVVTTTMRVGEGCLFVDAASGRSGGVGGQRWAGGGRRTAGGCRSFCVCCRLSQHSFPLGGRRFARRCRCRRPRLPLSSFQVQRNSFQPFVAQSMREFEVYLRLMRCNGTNFKARGQHTGCCLLRRRFVLCLLQRRGGHRPVGV